MQIPGMYSPGLVSEVLYSASRGEVKHFESRTAPRATEPHPFGRRKSTLKIKNINNPQRFFEVLKDAKGRVELVTNEGDRLNLKSTLSQYIILTQIFKDAKIDEVDLVVSEPDDLNMLLDYLVRG